MKVALVHDWLTGMRGGENCLEVLCELYPDADLFTLLYVKDRLSGPIEGMKIRTSFLQRFPGISTYYRYCLPLFPTAIEGFNLKGYDLVVSTSHCVAKGVLPAPDSLHLCYCFTPMRYVWDMQPEYFQDGRSRWEGLFMPFLAHYLRMWDATSSQRVDFFVAISHHVQRRIRKYYGRDSTVVYPPVDCDFFCPSVGPAKEGDYFLAVTALAPYKRLGLAVEAFNRMGRPLVVVGQGQGFGALKKRANKNIEFVGWQTRENVREYYRGCRAFIFPGEEDFGIAPLEAAACGRPVIAFGRGGCQETLVPFPGERAGAMFFDEPTPESLIDAVGRFERNVDCFDREAMRQNALRFRRDRFRDQIGAVIEERYRAFSNEHPRGFRRA